MCKMSSPSVQCYSTRLVTGHQGISGPSVTLRGLKFESLYEILCISEPDGLLPKREPSLEEIGEHLRNHQKVQADEGEIKIYTTSHGKSCSRVVIEDTLDTKESIKKNRVGPIPKSKSR